MPQIMCLTFRNNTLQQVWQSQRAAFQKSDLVVIQASQNASSH